MLNIKNILRISIRPCSSKIRKLLNTPQDISQLLSTPIWNIQDLMEQDSNRTNLINKEQVQKLLQLSGLEVRDEVEINEIITNLKEQVKFIDQLHSVEVMSTATFGSSLKKELTLSGLQEQISLQKSDFTKGEITSSWNPMSIAKESKHGNYIVKENLIKDKQ